MLVLPQHLELEFAAILSATRTGALLSPGAPESALHVPLTRALGRAAARAIAEPEGVGAEKTTRAHMPCRHVRSPRRPHRALGQARPRLRY